MDCQICGSVESRTLCGVIPTVPTALAHLIGKKITLPKKKQDGDEIKIGGLQGNSPFGSRFEGLFVRARPVVLYRPLRRNLSARVIFFFLVSNLIVLSTASHAWRVR